MARDHDMTRLRRYALGALPEEERAAIEQEYFADADALERLSIAEEELIEDYLEDRLDAEARDRFERHYLSTPGHRARVSVMRGLMTTAARVGLSPNGPVARDDHTPPRGSRARIAATARWSPVQQIALAASVALVLGAGALWLFLARQDNGGRNASTSSAPSASAPSPAVPSAVPSPSPRAPVIVAVSLSAIAVRGDGVEATVMIPAEADLLELRLEGESDGRPLRGGRAVVRTVDGEELWRGPVDSPGNGRPRAVVRIPAGRLQSGDLIVALHALDANGRDAEQARYAVRVKLAARR